MRISRDKRHSVFVYQTMEGIGRTDEAGTYELKIQHGEWYRLVIRPPLDAEALGKVKDFRSLIQERVLEGRQPRTAKAIVLDVTLD